MVVEESLCTTTSEPSLRTEYEARGFVGPIDVLDPSEAASVLQEFQLWMSAQQEAIGSPDHQQQQQKQQVTGSLRFKSHLFLPFFNRIVRHPALIAAVQDVLGTKNIVCWSSDWNIKPPNSLHYFAPHQDATYAGLDPSDQVVTAWVALSDPVTETEGCLQFWPGTHRKGQLPHTENTVDGAGTDPNNLLSRGQRCNPDDATTSSTTGANTNTTSPVAMELRGGQASLHHFYTVHQSGPNQSKKQARVGLAIRYMTDRVRQTGIVARESVTWISGNQEQQHAPHRDAAHVGNYGCFDWEPILPAQPTVADLERGQRAHAIAVQREAGNYFATSSAPTKRTSYD